MLPGPAAVATLVTAENSDVLPAASVAVAVTTRPVATPTGKLTENAALPLPSVLTAVKPRKVWPSPKPDGSAASLAKNSSRKPVVLGVLLNVPATVVLPPALTAEVITGKF